MTDIESLTKRYVGLADLERELKAKLDEVQKSKAEIEPQIMDHWANHGIESQRVNGVTIYPHRQVWASHGGDPQRAVAAMRAVGLDDLVTVNSQTLSAWVREKQANGEAIPPEVEGAIIVTERVSLRTRRS
jgi:hypothetical protein